MSDDKIYDFAAQQRHETDKALLLHDGERQFWVPKSLAQDNNDGTFTVPEWWAIENKLV